MIEFHRSSNKHGVHPHDILHAIEHSLVSTDLEPDADPPKSLTIGPDRAGNMIEVVLLKLANNNRFLVIHAMKLRKQFNELLPGAKGPT